MGLCFAIDAAQSNRVSSTLRESTHFISIIEDKQDLRDILFEGKSLFFFRSFDDD